MDKRILTLTGGILTGIALFVFLLCYQTCDHAPAEQITRVDTVYLPSKDKFHTLQVKVPVPYKVFLPGIPGKTDTFYRESRVDTAGILLDYSRTRLYTDTAANDSVKIYYNARVSQNVLQELNLGYKWIAPTREIKTTKYRNNIFIGADLVPAGIYPGAYIETKNWMFGAGYDPFNKKIKAGAYFKVW